MLLLTHVVVSLDNVVKNKTEIQHKKLMYKTSVVISSVFLFCSVLTPVSLKSEFTTSFYSIEYYNKSDFPTAI